MSLTEFLFTVCIGALLVLDWIRTTRTAAFWTRCTRSSRRAASGGSG